MDKFDFHKFCVRFLKILLNFKLTFDVQYYMVEKEISRWRDFEEEQHHLDYPIKGAGLIVTPSKLKSWTFRKDTILHLEEDLAPEETGAEIGEFPLQTVSVVYIYSLLEDFGNTICDKIHPSYRKSRQAWHHGVYADCDLEKEDDIEKALTNFCKPFGFNKAKIPIGAIVALVELKKERNKIVHELRRSDSFELMFRCVMMVASSIYFQCPRARKELKIYNWTDYHDKYKS